VFLQEIAQHEQVVTAAPPKLHEDNLKCLACGENDSHTPAKRMAFIPKPGENMAPTGGPTQDGLLLLGFQPEGPDGWMDGCSGHKEQWGN
jgi:hypothetical protein